MNNAYTTEPEFDTTNFGDLVFGHVRRETPHVSDGAMGICPETGQVLLPVFTEKRPRVRRQYRRLPTYAKNVKPSRFEKPWRLATRKRHERNSATTPTVVA